MKYVVNLRDVTLSHLDIVGGKNASLGEMIKNLSHIGILVPHGFATTTEAFHDFLAQQQLAKLISATLQHLDVNNTHDLNKKSAKIRQLIIKTPFSAEFEENIKTALQSYDEKSCFAIRSSATAEDLPEASFAGQQETFLNVCGYRNILKAIKKVFASLFTSRAIAYRQHHNIAHEECAISVGIQTMIESKTSGVMFTVDTETGFDKVVLINASYGLGEALVQGQVNPDEFYVYKPMLLKNKPAILQRKCGTKEITMIGTKNKNLKQTLKTISTPVKKRNCFCLNDDDIHQLARLALIIENHYGKPMDIEWAKDSKTNKLYILQARPETINGRHDKQTLSQYKLLKQGKIITQGLSIGQSIGAGSANIIADIKKMKKFQSGQVLVADMTDPDWEPIMKKASAIVTNRGGRTCHAAIIARELGIPAVVGCGNATQLIKQGDVITVACTQGETGVIYKDKIPFTIKKVSISDFPELPIKLCLNIGNPDMAFSAQFLPNNGVGLARLEFIINAIGIHPNAILNLKTIPKKLQKEIRERTAAYHDPREYYVEKLKEGIAKITAAFHPKPVIFRFSDFKSNEYANLLGGKFFEPHEENPMLGFRGASRYYDEKFRDCFELECAAFKRVHEMGLTNAELMIPFVRTVSELEHVLAVMAKFGLKRNKNLKIYMMCEIPSNVILAKQFLQYVDGYSIGSNDLTQLVLGLDRDSTIIAHLFDERNDAIKTLLANVIQECRQQKKYIGICGQAPSDYPEFAVWLMQTGVEAMSLSGDSIVETWLELGKVRELSNTSRVD